MSFIKQIAPHAKRIQKEFNILASIIIAQAIHESNWGKSGLATKGKNLFGIKGNFKGQSVIMKTAEFNKNGKYFINAAFRRYPSWYESLYDLANLYKNGVSWDKKKYLKVIGEFDYKKASQAIEKAGYATDPGYAEKLINTIEKNNLTIYDYIPYPGKPLEKGSKNKYVGMVQRKLDISNDNNFGEKTLAAVIAFQKQHGLVVDGIVGKLTWNKIYK